MSRTIQITQLGLLALLIFTQSTTAAERREPAKAGLEAEHARQIQAIGQAVLAAKHGEAANPEMEALRQRVEELRKAVIKLDAPTLEMGKISLGGGRDTPGSAPGQEAEKQQGKINQAEKDVREVLERVRRQRALAQSKAEAPGAVDQARRADRRALSKVRELEDDLEKAISLPPEERAQSLRTLRERLEIKPRNVSDSQQEKTPTISTIVRHRQ